MSFTFFHIHTHQQILSIEDRTEAMNETFVLILILIGLGIVMFLAAILQTFFFSKAGARLTIKLRLVPPFSICVSKVKTEN